MKFLFLKHIFSLLFTLLMVLYITPIIIKIALKFRVLDFPDGGIKNHKRPTPYLGGLAIYISLITALSIVYPFENKILWLLLGATLLLFVGLIDDFSVLRPYQKLFGQFLAVLCFMKGGFSLKTQFFSHFFNILASGFWLLLVINAFNLVDVMDGLATTLALSVTLSFFVIAILFKQFSISIFMISLFGCLLGFLFFNKPKAQIYLGDAGSLFLGGFLAAAPLLLNWSSQFYFAYYVPIIVLGVPLIEVFSLIFIRTMKGIPFYKGSPHHFAIYLKKKGWSEKGILGFSFLATLILFVIALLFLFKYITLKYMLIFMSLYIVAWILFIFF